MKNVCIIRTIKSNYLHGKSYHDYIFESKHKIQKKIFFCMYVIMITFRALEEFVKEKLPAFGKEKRDYILSVKLSRLQIIRREFV